MEDVRIKYRIKHLKGVSEGVTKNIEVTIDNIQSEGLTGYLWRTGVLDEKDDTEFAILERKLIPVF